MNKLEKLLNMVDSCMLFDMAQEVNSWDGSLEYLHYIDMEELDGYLEGYTPTDIANMIHHGEFNPYDDYFRFNVWGNLVSYSEWEMQAELEDYKKEIVERFIELYEQGHVDIWGEEVKAILDSEEEEEEA